MILGLTGPMASGKSTVVNALKNIGYQHITLSQFVREEAEQQGVEQERENLMAVGQDLREKGGAGVLGQRALDRVNQDGGGKWIVDGIRNPAEVEALRQHPDFILIANTATEDQIISRIFSRKRSDDTLDEAAIRHKLRREMGEGEPPEGQQVAKCIEMADYEFENVMAFEEVGPEFMKLYDEIARSKD